jgi:hypothetical protein
MKTSRLSLISLRRAPLVLCVSTMLAFGFASTNAWSEEAAAPANDEPVPAFTPAMMKDPANT